MEYSPTLEPLISQIKEVTPPQRNELSSLLLQIHSGNTYARERAITMYMRMVIRIAVGYVEKTEVPFEDLVSEGTIGLIAAIDRYDASIHGYFTSYASLWIRQVLDRYVLYQKSLIHIPVHAYDLLIKIEKTIEPYPFDETMQNKKKISSEFNISIQEVERAMALLRPVISLNYYDEYEQDDTSEDDVLYDNCFDKIDFSELCCNDFDENCDKSELNLLLQDVINTLSDKERTILLYRTGLFNGHEYTLEQVGKFYGVTRERIRQIENKAIRKLRHPSRSKKIKAFL